MSIYKNLSRRSVMQTFGALAIANLAPSILRADENPDWTTALPPHRIADNLYYVGSRDLAAFLITAPGGHILINSNLASSPPQIRASIEKLGFHYKDVKILLISHAHYDHCAGSAQILRDTGAKNMVMDADVPEIEAGGHGNFRYADQRDMLYPAAKVDRTLHDGDQVKLGGATLTAHKTAGHTKGCTTWTLEVTDKGKTYNAVIVGSPNVNPGYNLIDDPKYPQMAADFTRQFQTLKSLPCDIFLGAHGGYYDMLEKATKIKASSVNPFIDPAGYREYIADRQKAFETELARQKHARSDS
jgi:metallo-beta-lactamase class B